MHKNGIVKLYKKKYIVNTNIITLRDHCKANLENHVLSHHMTIDLEINYQFNTIGIDLKEILQLTTEETEEFVKFAKEKLDTSQTQLKLIDIKRKYQLHTISKHQSLLQKVKSIVLAIITVICLVILLYFIIKLSLKLIKTRKGSRKEVDVNINLAKIDKKDDLYIPDEMPKESDALSLTSKY